MEFICSAYAEHPAVVSNSYVPRLSPASRRKAMLDLALFLGFALLCGYVAYERFCKRW
jgi:hypothetical protein